MWNDHFTLMREKMHFYPLWVSWGVTVVVVGSPPSVSIFFYFFRFFFSLPFFFYFSSSFSIPPTTSQVLEDSITSLQIWNSRRTFTTWLHETTLCQIPPNHMMWTWEQGGAHTWLWWNPHKKAHRGTNEDTWSWWSLLELFYYFT